VSLDLDTAAAAKAADAVVDDGAALRLHTTLQSALRSAQDQLLDRSLRNKLISTNVINDRARQIRVFDELSDVVLGTLKTGVQMTFAPGQAARGTDQASHALTEDQADGAPTARDGADLNASARRADRTLQTRLTPEGLQKRLTSLYYEGQTIEEEQGVSVLFLALGFLEWREANHSEIPRFAPLILVPVELSRPSAGARFRLTIREDDLFTNVSLQALLREQFDIRLPDLPEAEDLAPSAYFDAVAQAAGQRPGWRVHPNEIVLGFFSFSKFLLWRDLNPENWPTLDALLDCALLKHVLLRDDGDELRDTPVIADDEVIEEKFASAELIHITDADSSQAIAIQEAMAGKNLVIQGPPGTGKSQTITNIIAGAVKRGRRVLFVAEKMAALEVVHDRLVKANLGPLCLELHSRKASKQQVLAQIREGREAAAPPAWSGRVLDELDETQALLRRHSRRLHSANGAALTPFEILGGITRWRALGAPAPTFQFSAAGAWTADQLETSRRRAKVFSARLERDGPPCRHPWRGLGAPVLNELDKERLAPSIHETATSAEALAAAACQAADVLDQDHDPALKDGPTWVAALGCLAGRPVGVDALLADERLASLIGPLAALADEGERLTAIRARLATQVRPEAWSVDWGGVRRTIAGQGRSLLRLLSSKYREAVGELRGVWQGDLPTGHAQRLEALDALIDGARLADVVRSASTSLGASLGPVWREEGTDWALVRAIADWIAKTREFEPKIVLRSPARLVEPSRASAAQAALSEAALAATSAFKRLVSELKIDRTVAFDGAQDGGVLIAHLVEVTGRWRDHLGLIDQWAPIRDDLAWLEEIGGADLARAVFRADVPAKQIEGVLMLAVYEAMWARVRTSDPEIERTAGDDLTGLVERFRRADRDRIRIAADEVRRAHLDQHPTGTAGPVGILIDEIKKARRLKPVRKLMAEAGEAIQRFKPVFLMSPLSVAQYLPPGRIKFDLLVIDEASQVRPEDALGAIARCDQLIVVGDDRQLPPTSFFSRMVNDEDDPVEDEDQGSVEGQPRKADVRDVESILNLCNRFPERMLRWHYRSEHPSLIATSNQHFYDGKLMLPPSVLTKAGDGETGLVFRQVQRGGYERGKTARNEIEAGEVAQAVLVHAREHSDLSLGIGAFSVAQRDAIRESIDNLARVHPQLDAFLNAGAHGERVFVKNLENIQGDERDVIFISVGYGHSSDGRLTQQFGPVGRDGGDRRLNVLITRARKRCEAFSSIVAEDIRIEAGSKPGLVALRAFLKLAKDGFQDVAGPTGGGFDSDFEEAVALEIEKLGYRYHPQVGMAGFFIDLGVLDPREPDRYLMGVECDGAAYHSSRYARDRDRLRQMILEKRGWKLHRIWSSDWLYRRDREVAKLKDAIEAALAGRSLPTAAEVYDSELPLAQAVAGVEEPLVPFDHDAPGFDARPERAGLRPYEFTKFRQSTREPHTLSAGTLALMVERIVRVEQPIHEEEVGRRLAHVCGLQKAGSRIQPAALRGLLHAKRQGALGADGPFWSVDPRADPDPRSRAHLTTAEYVRKPEMIGPAELRATAMVALRENLALDHEELVTETARLIGFARVGPNVREAIEAAIGDFSNKVERDHLGRYKLKT
jgi:very-short-patch-repair endonuclease